MNFDFNTHELAWAAGFFDGEGYVAARLNFVGKPNKRAIVIRVDQHSDNQVVLFRFSRALGTRQKHKGDIHVNGTKPYATFAITNFEGVQFAIALLWLYLSPLKKQQA